MSIIAIEAFSPSFTLKIYILKWNDRKTWSIFYFKLITLNYGTVQELI